MLSLFLSFSSARRFHRRDFGGHIPVPLVSNANGVGTCIESAGVNVRSGAGTSYSKIGSIAKGGTITITGYSGEWWKISYGSKTGYVKAEYFTVPAKVTPSDGLNIRTGPGTSYSKVTAMPCGAQCTVKDVSNGWFKVTYGSSTGWASAEYLAFTSSTTPDTPSGSVIRQGDSRFNSNIRKWGCAFMSSCWCGGVNSIDGCNSLYNTAINNGWMRADCYINSWYSVASGLGKAKTYKYGSKSYSPASNEKEILWCKNSQTSSHFVVGNKRGGIEYDPAYDGRVRYSDCQDKRIFVY